jgi:hypothetical protein
MYVSFGLLVVASDTHGQQSFVIMTLMTDCLNPAVLSSHTKMQVIKAICNARHRWCLKFPSREIVLTSDHYNLAV